METKLNYSRAFTLDQPRGFSRCTLISNPPTFPPVLSVPDTVGASGTVPERDVGRAHVPTTRVSNDRSGSHPALVCHRYPGHAAPHSSLPAHRGGEQLFVTFFPFRHCAITCSGRQSRRGEAPFNNSVCSTSKPLSIPLCTSASLAFTCAEGKQNWVGLPTLSCRAAWMRG